jgi:HSP20 family protein
MATTIRKPFRPPTVRHVSGVRPVGTAAPSLLTIESFVTDGNLVIRAGVPGLEAKDVDQSALDDILAIGLFERGMTLPERTDPDEIKASFENGVIEITMPMAKEV